MAIHLYRPQRTPIETLLACNVGRSHFVESVLDDLRARNAGDSRQHFMFIGPRGIGKTTLLRLIAHGVTQDPDLANRYLPVALPEEGYSLSRVSDFMVHMVQILSQDLGREELADVYDQVRHDDDHQRVVDRVVEAMRRFHRQTGLGVVLMFENAHRFLERQKRNKDELHLLRALMMSETWLTGVFTSPTYLNALVDAKEPFFEFFKVLTLGELTQDELLEVLHKLTEHENNQVFREYLAKHSSRVRALYHFTGGNPRLALMLYELVTKHDIVGVREELDQLLDQITPFYQDRMKDLSEQEAKVIEAMSLIPEGCTPKDLARETRLGGGTTRMVLTRLENAGYVKHEKRSGKKTVYYIQERLFRIWNQVNNSRAAKGMTQYLIDFFASWYSTKSEREDAWNQLVNKLDKTHNTDTSLHESLTEYMRYIHIISDKHESAIRSWKLIVSRVLNDEDATSEIEVLCKLHKGDEFGEELILSGAWLSETYNEKILQLATNHNDKYHNSVISNIILAEYYHRSNDQTLWRKHHNRIFECTINNIENKLTKSRLEIISLFSYSHLTYRRSRDTIAKTNITLSLLYILIAYHKSFGHKSTHNFISRLHSTPDSSMAKFANNIVEGFKHLLEFRENPQAALTPEVKEAIALLAGTSKLTL